MNSKTAALKHKAVHELEQLIGISLYLAFFFCAITTYGIVLRGDAHGSLFSYAFALVNAFVIAKVILIGEYFHLGKKYEEEPLLLSAFYKAFVFSLLALGFHFAEEAIKGVIHGQRIAETFYETSWNLLFARALVVFATFVPFFGFRELRRILGEENFRALFIKSGPNAPFHLPSGGRT